MNATKPAIGRPINYPGTLYSEVLDGWNETRVQVQGGGNAIKSELILTNFVAPAPTLFDGAAQ